MYDQHHVAWRPPRRRSARPLRCLRTAWRAVVARRRIEQITSANALVRQYCATHRHLSFVDIAAQMLGADGKPRKELLLDDGLHMTPAGYRIWNDALRPLLQPRQSNQ